MEVLMQMRTMFFTVFTALTFFGAVPSNGATLINGAGATFPYPLYSRWFSEFNKNNPDTQINYQSIGSGGGVRQFLEKTVDFGASDAPMKDEDLAKAGVGVLHIPTVMGAVVLTYNIKGIDKGLKLSSDVVADIFLGTIKKWDDERIKKLNPTAKLAGDILVIRRSDGSGTTAIFTDYLSKVSADWKSKVGQGTAVSWPVGLGGKGNEGVTGLVKQTEGSIGYVELIYAESNKLAYATIKNSAGEFITPSLESVTEAGAKAVIPADFRVSITNAPGKKAYPISGFTYLLVYKQMGKDKEDKAGKLVKFLKWSMTDGQKYAKELFYSPIPKSLVPKVQAAIASIEVKPIP